MKTKYYAIYARQSVDKPDSISIESQIEQCLYEVKESPYKVYYDQGYSGKSTDRPQFQAMLNAIYRGEIQRVICYKLDRCSRSVLDFTQLMATFQQYGVEFISCTEKFDTGTPMGRAMLNICIVFAQLERETIQQRITDSYHSRCKKGFFMGGRVPFGYSLIPFVLEGKKTARYEIIPTEAEIIVHMYSVYSKPTSSLSDVVISLKENNITNPRREDGLWVRPHIGRMIKNPIYLKADRSIYSYFKQQNAYMDNPIEEFIGENGCYLYRLNGEKHLVLAPHKGIVSSRTWLQCQSKDVKKNMTTNNTTENTSWLVGKLKCAKCGRAIIIKQTTSKSGQIYRYFICSGANGKDRQCEGIRCLSVNKVEKTIENLIVDHIGELSKHEQQYAQAIGTIEYLQQLLQKVTYSCTIRDNTFTQIEQTLLDLHFQFKMQRDEGENYHDNETWSEIYTRLSQWDFLPRKKKVSIANLLINSVQLNNMRIAIKWTI